MTERWKDVKGYEGLYQVSTHGRVHSSRRHGTSGGILKGRDNSAGYFQVTLCKGNSMKLMYIHRLVAVAFIPNPENKPWVNHKDCDKTNNFVDNLEWVTLIEDRLHASKMGRLGPRPRTGLSDKDVLEIRSSYLAGATSQDLVDDFEVTYTTIYRILRRKTWTHI